jgi:threonine synthase
VAASLPQLVILDLVLPKVGGIELLAEWRSDPRTAELPIFVLTSKELTAQEKSYLRANTQSLFHKQESWQGALLKQLQRAVGKPQAVKV